MTRASLIVLLALAPLAARSQEAGTGAEPPIAAGAALSASQGPDGTPEAGQPPGDGTPAPPAAEAPEEPQAPLDPVAAWEADRRIILSAEGVDLGAFEYLARPLVVFGDSPRQPQVIEQLRLIEADLGSLEARDVVIILDTDPEARSAVRRELRPRGFGLVLVDKDGRVALRRPAPVPVRELSRAIDRSPIRQEEIRLGNG